MQLVPDYGLGIYGQGGGLHPNYVIRNIMWEVFSHLRLKKETDSVLDFMPDSLICYLRISIWNLVPVCGVEKMNIADILVRNAELRSKMEAGSLSCQMI